jgi:hypothetical protein
MAIIIGVVLVVIIVIIAGVIITPTAITAIIVTIPIAVIVAMRIAWTMPAPTIAESMTIVAIIMIVRTIIGFRPPPIIAIIDTYPPIGRNRVVPIEIGEIGVVIAPSTV